jgi:acyl-CoA reductase-like NAD-dependent aldehyde dehydrogenase
MSFKTRKDPIDRYLFYAAGKWNESTSSIVYPNLNPANRDESLGEVCECTPEEVDLALRAATDAFPAWRKVSGNIKTKMFLRLARTFEDNSDEFVRTMTREMGKTHFDSKLDLDEAIGVLECVAPQGASLKGETYQKNAEGVVMESRLEPRGVAAIITPFNFPIAIPTAQIVSALVTGNTVVWKPSHLIPESSQLLALAIEEILQWACLKFEITIPAGVFNMITGDSEAGNRIVRDPAVKCISFTGSKVVGDSVDSVGSGLGKRVMKEVGGVNIFYVHADADIQRAARNFVYGKTITTGQRCTSIQEVLCDEGVYDQFLAAVVNEAAGIVLGDGASEELAQADREPGLYSLPPVVSEEQQLRVRGLIDQSIAGGGKIVYQTTLPDGLSLKGNYVPFTILEKVSISNILYDTEIFGPVAVFTKVSGVQEAVSIINEKIGIVACIDSTNKDASEYFIQNVLRTRVDDGRHGTGAFWATRFGGDRGAGSGNPALDENMVYGYVLWKTIYRSYRSNEELAS